MFTDDESIQREIVLASLHKKPVVNWETFPRPSDSSQPTMTVHARTLCEAGFQQLHICSHCSHRTRSPTQTYPAHRTIQVKAEEVAVFTCQYRQLAVRGELKSR